MQLRGIRTTAADLRDLLSLRYRLLFLDKDRIVMGVGRQVGIVVLDDHELSVTPQSLADVDHLATGAGIHRFPLFPRDVQALVVRLGEACTDPPASRPSPVDFLVVTFTVAFTPAAFSQQPDFNAAQVKVTELAKDTFMLEGEGGNITFAGGLDDGGTSAGTNGLITGLSANDGLPDGYAINFGTASKPVFTDLYTPECSHDIEPMKGGHGDKYFRMTQQFIKKL